MPASLQAALESALRGEANRLLAGSILGSHDAATLAGQIEALCMDRLGAEIEACLCCGFSVGASFGLALTDGSRIFLKVNRPSAHLTFELRSAISMVQDELARAGFPCPRVILPPFPFGAGFVTVDQFVGRGVQRDAHDPTVRGAMASALADLVRLARPLRARSGIPESRFIPLDRLYPEPHNALFDFDRTAEGAEWIDRIAARAREEAAAISGESLLTHVDWSTKHFRFDGGQISAVFDWDSLTVTDELAMLGIAAATFPATWELDLDVTPTPREALAFVREYEKARGSSFSSAELRKIAAAVTYTLAYSARCEHALAVDGLKSKADVRTALRAMTEGSYLGV